MKKILHTLALAALTLSTTVHAHIASNRTYIRVRDSLNHNSILAMSGNARGTDVKGNRLGGTFSVTPYYRSSHNAYGIAQNFGGGQEVNNNQYGRIVVEPGNVQLTGSGIHSSTKFQSEAYNIYSQHIDHTATSHGTTTAESARGISGSIALNPCRTEMGAHISLNQKVDFLFQGLSLSLDMPLVEITHDLNPLFTGFAHAADASGQTGATLAQYFSGKRFVKADTATQEQLRYAKITRNEHSVAGIADIQLAAQYPLFSNETFRFNGAATVVVPTSKKTSGEFLFAPRLGSGHVRLGAKATVMAHLLKHEQNHYGLHGFGSLHYQYNLKAEQTRTLGIYNHWYNVLATSGHYRNLGLDGANTAIPAANLLTRTVIVKPGQTIDGIMGIRFHCHDFSGSITYNLHAHEAEKINLAPGSRWFDNEYGILGIGCDISDPIEVAANEFTFGGALQQEGSTATKEGAASNNNAQNYITTIACAGRADVTHKIAGSLEWHYKKLRFPITVSGGCEYEFPHTQHSNSGIHSWALWSKLSVCF